MEKQFCGYEIALQLKELGFDEKCFGYFEIAKEIKIEVSYNSDPNLIRRDFIAAPLWQQAIEYIKNTYDIYILIIPANRYYNIEISKYDEDDDRNIVLDLGGLEFKDFLSYRDAREQAILKAIELIKDIK